LQELIDWREDQITQFIQWMLLESEVIKASLPGTEIKNELATAEAKKAEAERQKEVEAAAVAEWIRRAPEREVRKQIASAEGEITANWKTIGLSLGSLAALFLLALGSSQIANQQVN